MHVSRVIVIFAFGFMLGVVLHSAAGFSWWILSVLIFLSALFGIIEAVDASKETLLAFFIAISLLAGFLISANFSQSFSD